MALILRLGTETLALGSLTQGKPQPPVRRRGGGGGVEERGGAVWRRVERGVILIFLDLLAAVDLWM